MPKDNAAAIVWYRKAAEQGDAKGQNALGYLYLTGESVPQDYSLAISWFRKAAEQGHPQGQFNLGHMYYEGQGVPQDYIQAHKWFNIAASRYGVSEKDNRDEALIFRNAAAAKMTPAQIAEAQKLASEWKPNPMK